MEPIAMELSTIEVTIEKERIRVFDGIVLLLPCRSSIHPPRLWMHGSRQGE